MLGNVLPYMFPFSHLMLIGIGTYHKILPKIRLLGIIVIKLK
jgi:hypothetical protein